jgi:hypothetical protein
LVACRATRRASDPAGEQPGLTNVLTAGGLLAECLWALEGLDVWVGAGAVAATMWNTAHGYPDGCGIHDVDVVYFDPDLSVDAAHDMVQEVSARLQACPFPVDVKNQARVHRWYPQRFGHQIRAYTCLEDAVASWPTTATAVAVRAEGSGIDVLAPFGLDDLGRLAVRANRVQAPRKVFEDKTARWSRLWPRLTVSSWTDGVGSPGARWR